MQRYLRRSTICFSALLFARAESNAYETESPGLEFRYGVKNIPHFEKVEKGGEDAWVAQSDLLVVADGVGGWADQGVDAGLFSKQLCRDIKSLFDIDPHHHLKQILVESVKIN